MSYLARFVMLTLLLDEYSANSPAVHACIPPSTSIRPCLALCAIRSSFDASNTFLFCAVGNTARTENSYKQPGMTIDFLGNVSVTFQ